MENHKILFLIGNKQETKCSKKGNKISNNQAKIKKKGNQI